MHISGHASLPSGLIAYWTLDTGVQDATGNGHDGVLEGSPTNQEGKIDNGYDFNGTSDSVDLGTDVEYNASYITISAWAKPDAATGTQAVVGKRGHPGDTYHCFWLRSEGSTSPATWEFGARGQTTEAVINGTVKLDAGEWFHIVGVYDGTAVKLYVDGVFVGSTPLSDGALNVNSSIPLLLAANVDGGDVPDGRIDYFAGMIDEVGIWDRALTTVEIETLYYRGVGLRYAEEPIPFAFVKIGEMVGSEIPMPPRVSAAVATAYNKVRVEYDQEMYHANPSDPYDALNPSNYAFPSGVGISRNGQSVALLSAAPTIVEVTLDGEMTNGVSYAATVSNVRSSFNEALDPQYSSQNYTGLGVLPQVSAAVALGSSSIQVDFSEPMLDNAAFVTKTNYVIGGYGTVSVISVAKNSETRVTLTTEATMKTGETYTVTVSNVQDQALNYLDPSHKSANFTGIGEHPKLISSATPIDTNTVQIEFTKDVVASEATDPDNYQIQRAGGVFLELWKWWEFTGAQGLKCKAAVESEYDPGSNDVTIVAVFNLDANDERVFFDKLDGTDNGYRLETVTSGELKATFGDGSLSSVQTAGEAVPTGERVLVALRFDYDAVTPTLEAVHVSSGGLKKNSATISAAGDSTELLHALIASDSSGGTDGKAYWIGYFDSLLSDSDLQNLQSEIDHPLDHSPKVYVDFHKDVDSTYKPEKSPTGSVDWYFEIIGTPTKVGATQLTGTEFQLKTADQNTGNTYTITVLPPDTPYPTGIHDLIGNECKTPDNTATFVGIGVSPPYIDIEPPDDERDVAVRNQLRVHIWDDPEEFSGINETSIWIEIIYTDTNDIEQTIYLVNEGDIKPHATGTKTGTGSDADGIYFRLLPRQGRWEANTTYTVRAYAADVEGSPNLTQQTFRTTSLTCFEDLLPTQDDLDTKLLTPLAGAHIEKLRQIMLQSCTQSRLAQVQARTLLHVAGMTELRAVLASTVDFGLVDSIKLCDRQPLWNIQQKMSLYWPLVKPAMTEIQNITLEARRMIERYIASNSSVYAISALATAIVLAAVSENG